MRKVAFLGSHTPRQCGIATFTADLREAVSALSPELGCPVVAMDDVGKRYVYPEHVRCEVSEEKLASYRRAADYLNVADVDVLSLQHEFGIFGGKAGAHVLTLLRGLRMPIVTTLHTVLAEPDAPQRAVMGEICSLSERLVVMSASSADLLSRVYAVDPAKIDMIPHGIPRLPDAAESKSKLGLNDRTVLLTFGLLSPDKGIEHVIDALPAIVERHPEVIYVVLGATHPHVKERHGEAYRLMLEARAERMGVNKHLLFHDRFAGHAELVQFLAATDLYVTPYLNAEQSTSGTLAYAVGSGKVAISSPYRYAREILADGRGVLVPAASPSDVAREVVALIEDEPRTREIQKRASALGSSMLWPAVARAYQESFRRAFASYGVRRRAGSAKNGSKRASALPEVNLGHLRMMTDDTGMLQHAIFAVPRYDDGYCLDDNARALLLLALVEEARIEPPTELRVLATRYLAFVRYAFDVERGRFRNFMSYSRTWTEPVGSEDSHGRALWALGTVIGRSGDAGRRALSHELFGQALVALDDFTSPRAWAYALLGVGECISAHRGDSPVRAQASKLAQRLHAHFRSGTPDWPWCEDRVTYCNARIPQAMMVSGLWMGNADMVAAGVRALDWLARIQTAESGAFAPIGTNGFFVRGGTKTHFDQQPVEACGMVAACLQAHRVTRDGEWLTRGRQAFDWYLGQNTLDQWLYDAGTGGCHDGLHRDRRNENQGAESTLSFLMALMDMRQWDRLVDSTPKIARSIERNRLKSADA